MDQRECGDFIQRRRCSAMKKAPSKRGLRRQCGELIGTPYPRRGLLGATCPLGLRSMPCGLTGHGRPTLEQVSSDVGAPYDGQRHQSDADHQHHGGEIAHRSVPS